MTAIDTNTVTCTVNGTVVSVNNEGTVLAMPGVTTRGRVRGLLRKIDSITELSPEESRLVMFALDERLRLEGEASAQDAEAARAQVAQTQRVESPIWIAKGGNDY